MSFNVAMLNCQGVDSFIFRPIKKGYAGYNVEIWVPVQSQQTQDFDPMLGHRLQCRTDSDATLGQRLVSATILSFIPGKQDTIQCWLLCWDREV